MYLLAIFSSFLKKKGCVKSVATDESHFLEFINNTTHQYDHGRKEWNCLTWFHIFFVYVLRVTVRFFLLPQSSHVRSVEILTYLFFYLPKMPGKCWENWKMMCANIQLILTFFLPLTYTVMTIFPQFLILLRESNEWWLFGL